MLFPSYLERGEKALQRGTDLMVVSLLVALLLVPGSITANSPQKLDLDTSVQPLADALKVVADSFDLKIAFFSDDTKGLQAPPLTGNFSASQAFDALLTGTALEYVYVNSSSVAIRLRSKEEAVAQTELSPDGDITMNDKKRSLLSRIAGALTLGLIAGGTGNFAGAADDSSDPASERVIEEIVVTARKKEESLKDAPVIMTAFSSEQIRQLDINSIDDLSRYTPGLQTSESANSNGGSVILRGIGNVGTVAPFADSSIGLNIDGMQVANNNIRKVSQIDMQQIEVLRGPQALFFGKNSPGGVVYISTADPGDEFEAEATLGYETESQDKYLRAIVSAPLSDTVGVRLVAQHTDKDGYFEVKNVDGGGHPLVIPANFDKWPEGEETYFRATLLADPSDQLSIRAKLHHSTSDTKGGNVASAQRIDCPTGTPQGFQIPFPCKKGSRDIYVGGGPTFGAFEGNTFRDFTQILGTFELNYEFDQQPLTFTSLTGYWDHDEDAPQNPSVGAVTTVVVSPLSYTMEQLTQEFRLTSSFDSMFNYTVGAFGEWKDQEQPTGVFFYVFGFGFPDAVVGDEQSAYSVFAQVEADLNERWTLLAGARYSYEEKESTVIENNLDVTGNLVSPEDDWNNVSPEVTLTYTPSDEWTFFASYKEGFKSGGNFPGAAFQVAAAAPGTFENQFEEELVTGFEFGAKGILLDDTLSLNLGLYSFEYDDLQVNGVTGDVESGSITFRVTNAASADVQGAEADFVWLPSELDGVTLLGTVAYNDSAYGTYLSQCYVAQSITAGCNILPDANGRFQLQDLGGKSLNNAPELTGSLTVSYDRQLNDDLLFNASLNFSYTDSFISDVEQEPRDFQDSYTKTNISLGLDSVDGRWGLSLVARNLEDDIIYHGTGGVVFAGGGPSGTADPAPSDLSGFPVRGREVFLRATYRWK